MNTATENSCKANAPTPEGIIRPMERSYAHPIRIVKVLNGYVCEVGCQTVVFENETKMLLEISRYLKNPAEVEKEYLKKQ